VYTVLTGISIVLTCLAANDPDSPDLDFGVLIGLLFSFNVYSYGLRKISKPVATRCHALPARLHTTFSLAELFDVKGLKTYERLLIFDMVLLIVRWSIGLSSDNNSSSDENSGLAGLSITAGLMLWLVYAVNTLGRRIAAGEISA
jgi:hypothetical protein